MKSYSGRCYCGGVKFEIKSANPTWVGICYCDDCKRISGSPYMMYVYFKKSEIDLTTQCLKEYNSSENVTRSFCGVCGCPYGYVYNHKPENIFLTIGMFDNPDQFEIQKHIFVSKKMKHITISDNAPQEL